MVTDMVDTAKEADGEEMEAEVANMADTAKEVDSEEMEAVLTAAMETTMVTEV